jgi:hypothetical protein
MKTAVNWIAAVLGVALGVAVAVGAYQLADYSWYQVVDYESPFIDAELPQARAGEQLTPRLVLVIVDGMGVAAIEEMPGLQALRGYGADVVAVTPQPSLSYPTWTTILSGAPPQVSGVTTNWYEGPVEVETLIDTAVDAGLATVVVGTASFETLYGAERANGTHLEDWHGEDYASGRFVDEALELAEAVDPSFMLVYLPDLDEVGHDHGADSEEYRQMADRIDGDIGRLVSALQNETTTFVICADHGHIATGGHGGWEEEVTDTVAIFVGEDIAVQQAEIVQADIAPTISALLGIPSPRNAVGAIPEGILLAEGMDVRAPARQQRAQAVSSFVEVVSGSPAAVGMLVGGTDEEVDEVMERVVDERLADERAERLTLALGVVAATLLVLAVVGVLSWRALVAALAGVAGYYLVYNLLFFIVHGFDWSLSAFNSEDLIQAFMNGRVIEGALSGLAGAAIAGVVYPLLRRSPVGPRGSHLPGWLGLGAATVLAIQATLVWQVAWYVWAWGVSVEWLIPDLRWGFKYDLDLLQLTGLGAAALVAPVVTLLVGRYHPSVRAAERASRGSER